MERHYGPIVSVINLKAIIWKEGGLRRSYSQIGYLAQIVLDSLYELNLIEQQGIPVKESKLQDLLLLHRKVMKLKEVREKEICFTCEAKKKPHSYYLEIQERRKKVFRSRY